MSHIPPGVTKKKRGVGVMDVMDFAIDEMDDAKRKKVIHYAMRKLQDNENELQDAVKCGEVAKVAKERAVKRAQDAEDRVQVLDDVLGLVYDDKDALKHQLEVAEKRAQDAEERAQVAEKRAQEEISNARSAQAFTSFTKRRRDEEWKDIVHGPGFNEILLTVAPASLQEPVYVPTPDEDGSCTPSRGAAPSSPQS